jgi:hypothetical protein
MQYRYKIFFFLGFYAAYLNILKERRSHLLRGGSLKLAKYRYVSQYVFHNRCKQKVTCPYTRYEGKQGGGVKVSFILNTDTIRS